MIETSAEFKKIERLFVQKDRGPKEIFSAYAQTLDVDTRTPHTCLLPDAEPDSTLGELQYPDRTP